MHTRYPHYFDANNFPAKKNPAKTLDTVLAAVLLLYILILLFHTRKCVMSTTRLLFNLKKHTIIHNRSIQYSYKREIQYQSYTHSIVFYHNITEGWHSNTHTITPQYLPAKKFTENNFEKNWNSDKNCLLMFWRDL